MTLGLLLGPLVRDGLARTRRARRVKKPQPSAATLKAEELARQAAGVARRGDFALAGRMFHAAYVVNQQAWAYLYSAARAEQLAKDIISARRDYDRFLSQAPRGHPLRPRATKYAGEVARAHAELMRRKRAKRRRLARLARARREAEKMTGIKRVVGWVALGFAGAAAAGGAWIYTGARSSKAALEDKTQAKPGQPIYAISYQEARTEADAIRGDLWLGGATLGTAAMLLGVGGWLLWSTRGSGSSEVAEASPVSLDLRVGDGLAVRLGWSF